LCEREAMDRSGAELPTTVTYPRLGSTLRGRGFGGPE
jgi:hypothetical protein